MSIARASFFVVLAVAAACGGSTSDQTSSTPPGTGGSTSGAGGEATGGSATGGSGGSATAGSGGSATAGSGGSATAGSGGSPTAGSGGASAGSGGATAGAGGSVAEGPCPATPPSSGTPCTGAFACTYGDNPIMQCRQRFVCQNGAFVDQTTGTICPMPGQNGCPATDPTNGASCGGPNDPEVDCGYPDGTVCICGACIGGPACPTNQPKNWACAAPPEAPCPATLPNEGQPCDVPAATMCTYGIPCGGAGVTLGCEGGIWVSMAMACPV